MTFEQIFPIFAIGLGMITGVVTLVIIVMSIFISNFDRGE